MRLGGAAGQADAANAQANLVAAGLPPTMPVYFACDYDATPGDQGAIDAYLRGAATVLGAGRVGIYGGYWIVSRCAENQSAKWFWQTTAWSGGNIFPGNHLYQHGYNLFIAGTNVDATRALQDNYGQASKFRGGKPAPQPKPVVAYPEGLDAGNRETSVRLLQGERTGSRSPTAKATSCPRCGWRAGPTGGSPTWADLQGLAHDHAHLLALQRRALCFGGRTTRPRSG
jgi:hypothetical protein